jgi:hypothetical protein
MWLIVFLYHLVAYVHASCPHVYTLLLICCVLPCLPLYAHTHIYIYIYPHVFLLLVRVFVRVYLHCSLWALGKRCFHCYDALMNSAISLRFFFSGVCVRVCLFLLVCVILL